VEPLLEPVVVEPEFSIGAEVVVLPEFIYTCSGEINSTFPGD
jgi:hypothetical protein